MPDPVALSIDNQGRVFVTRTKRRKSQDLDIRANRDWVPADVSMQSVQEKIDFYHQQMPLGGNAKNRVADLNKDGYHDYKDLQVLSEEILLVEDTTGNGKADSIRKFADGFNTEVTGIAAGVLEFNGEVYATIAPDVWKLNDTNNDGQADQRSKLATGFGLHIAYAGHDMHGLTVGPDGKIYWSIGDKGISAVSQEGKEFHYPNQGGVLRCNPDGSDFEVFAHGLRNVQELAFDQYGNLFGVDNDADQPSEKERFVYIAKGIDAGWRCNYQYRGKDYNPWTDEKLWQTRQDDHPIYFTPPIQNYVDGPAGFTYNPGTALSPEYQDYFFLTNAPRGVQYAFQTESDGASFKMVNSHEIGKGVAIVGINFGPDGALYGVDWAGGYPLNQTGAVWSIDTPQQANSPIRKEVKQLLKEGFSDRTAIELSNLLGHADQRVRLGAQFRLVQKKETDALVVATHSTHPQLKRIHAIWGLGQLARSGGFVFEQPLLDTLLFDQDEEIQCQMLKTIGDLKEFESSITVSKILESTSPRVQFFALEALASHPINKARLPIIQLIEKNNGQDVYLRHAAIQALTQLDNLQEFAAHPSVEVRRCAVVALRNQSNSEVSQFLSDQEELVVAEAVRAIHDDWSIKDSMIDLAQLLNQTDSLNEAILYRAINANYRLGDQASAQCVAQFTLNQSQSTNARLAAIDALIHWKNREELDRVDGRNRRNILSQRTRRIDKKSLHALLYQLLDEKQPEIQAAGLALIREWDVPLNDDRLLKLVEQEPVNSQIRIEAFSTLMKNNSKELSSAINMALKSQSIELRIHALGLLSKSKDNTHQKTAFEQVQDIIESSQKNNQAEIQQAILALGNLSSDSSASLLEALLADAVASTQGESTHLEVFEAAAQRKAQSENITVILAKLEKQRAKATKPDLAFIECLTGGDPKLGEKVFSTNINAQCIRCHKVGKQGSEVGPALDDVAIRRTPDYILRSIVSPSSDIDAKYRTRSVLLDSGKVIQGIVVSENDEQLVLKDAKGKEIKISVDEIEDEVEQKVSIMPDVLKNLSRREIRDIMAYLMRMQKAKK